MEAENQGRHRREIRGQSDLFYEEGEFTGCSYAARSHLINNKCIND